MNYAKLIIVFTANLFVANLYPMEKWDKTPPTIPPRTQSPEKQKYIRSLPPVPERVDSLLPEIAPAAKRNLSSEAFLSQMPLRLEKLHLQEEPNESSSVSNPHLEHLRSVLELHKSTEPEIQAVTSKSAVSETAPLRKNKFPLQKESSISVKESTHLEAEIQNPHLKHLHSVLATANLATASNKSKKTEIRNIKDIVFLGNWYNNTSKIINVQKTALKHDNNEITFLTKEKIKTIYPGLPVKLEDPKIFDPSDEIDGLSHSVYNIHEDKFPWGIIAWLTYDNSTNLLKARLYTEDQDFKDKPFSEDSKSIKKISDKNLYVLINFKDKWKESQIKLSDKPILETVSQKVNPGKKGMYKYFYIPGLFKY